MDDATPLRPDLLAKLTPERREALALREVAGLPLEEIGRRLGLDRLEVKRRLFRGREEYRRLAREAGEPDTGMGEGTGID
ncbi:MAG TPA: sigma factor-like helix-turn-helix DNA-binding protein [Thermomicrobiaceae bacterium]|nr:sigma factor-like helix-turn-helix DNA-binding protein [Thermomicrobiaceae bacterium]